MFNTCKWLQFFLFVLSKKLDFDPGPELSEKSDPEKICSDSTHCLHVPRRALWQLRLRDGFKNRWFGRCGDKNGRDIAFFFHRGWKGRGLRRRDFHLFGAGKITRHVLQI